MHKALVQVGLLRASAWALALCGAVWAADSVEVRTVGGTPALLVDGRAVPAHMLFNATWDRILVADSLAKAFRDAGIHLHQFDASMDWSDDFEGLDPATEAKQYRGLDERIRALAQMDPDVLVLLRTHLYARQTWAEAHPDEILTYQDGTKIFHSKWNACHSYASVLWRREAGRRLAALIQHLQRSGLEKHVLGYLLFAGWSGEWNFYRQHRGELPGKRFAELSNMTVDHSPAMAAAFRGFLRKKYGTDEGLQRAWQSDAASLAQAAPPTEEQVRAALPNQLNAGGGCCVASDYFECNAQQVGDALLHFARVAKAASPRRITGAFFGEYMFAHIGGNRTAQRSGHAELDRVLASPDLDFLCSPQAYQSRGLGGHSPSMCLVDSARLHGKLVWYEFDQPTHLAPKPPDEAPVPNCDVPQNLAETRALMRRGFGYGLTKGLGIWWWDQAGRWGKAVEGGVWYRSDEVRAEFALFQRIWLRTLRAPRVLPRPEIAVLYDPRQCFFQQPSWRDLSYDLIYRQLDALGKMGASYDVYSLGDAGQIQGYKLYIVWNAFGLTPAQATVLTQLTHREGVTTLWFYAPGYLDPTGRSSWSPDHDTMVRSGGRAEQRAQRCAALTGMEVTVARGLGSLQMKPTGLLDPGGAHPEPFGREKPVQPAFHVSGGRTLATYAGTDRPAAAMVEREGWRSVHFASAPLPSWVLRFVAKSAGCHQYAEGDEVVYVGRSHLTVHTAEPGRHRLRLPCALTVRDAVTGRTLSSGAQEITLECSGPTTWLLEVSR